MSKTKKQPKKQKKDKENMFIINLKTYEEGTGKNALNIALATEKAMKNSNRKIFLAVQTTDINMITQKTKVPIIAQHVDIDGYGGHTGSITLHAVKKAGAIGTLINHSEKRIPEQQIQKTIRLCKKNGMISVVCAKNADEIKKLSKYKPDFLAVEPPRLIGGKVSVSEAEPKTISNSAKKTRIPVLCGAGIHTTEDVKKAVELGAKGILVASGVVKAKDVYKEIMTLAKEL